MAGLLYLPRLFVYHCDVNDNTEMDITFKTMERRLYRFIMRPAMIFSWATGLFMAIYAELFFQIWFLVKFTLVILMTIAHEYMGILLSDFERDQNVKSQRFYRFLNEAPTILMIGIVSMVIAKPF